MGESSACIIVCLVYHTGSLVKCINTNVFLLARVTLDLS